MTATQVDHGVLMNRIYRRQRHIYDLTRRYYLLGRDKLIDGLDAPPEARILEIGCGTGRNLVAVARRYPSAMVQGIDISSEMLASAARASARSGLAERIRLAPADATDFDPSNLFGVPRFDRVFFSYTLSMIPDWRRALRHAVNVLEPSGGVHVVDFGQQERLPGWAKSMLFQWLKQFHVSPRGELADELGRLAYESDRALDFRALFRGYSWHGRLLPKVGPPT